MKIIRKANLFWKNQIERTVPDLRGDDGQNFPAFIDQIASAVKDVQNARVAGICQPVIYIGSKRKSVNGLLHPGPSLMYTPPAVREIHYLFLSMRC